MSKKKNPCVFLDLSIDGSPAERIVIEVSMLYLKDSVGCIRPFRFTMLIKSNDLQICSFLRMLCLERLRIFEHFAQVRVGPGLNESEIM